MIEGIINLDKPPGLSSARAVARVKRLLPKGTKIGHAGTLDPFATGVLLLLVGRATRQCEALMNEPKQYEATIKFGATTATADPESPEETFAHAGPVAPDEIERLLPRFVGAIQQRPPAFSAMKVGGRRAYDLARKGHDVELAPRTVHVYNIELLSYAWPRLSLRIDCGRGTYIRSIARDIGAELRVGGYLTALRRTAVGPFRAAEATTLERITESSDVQPFLQPIELIRPRLASLLGSSYNVSPDGTSSGSTGKDRP
jgi:tRNA pseudouridine55 synthase